MADHVPALLARRIDKRANELFPLAENLLAFAFTAPELLRGLKAELDPIPLPAGMVAKFGSVTPQPHSVSSLRNALQELARGMQYTCEAVEELARKHGRDPRLGPITITDDIHIVPQAEEGDEGQMYYAPDLNAIQMTMPFLKVISTLSANPRFSFSLDAAIPGLPFAPEQQVDVPVKAILVEVGIEEAYHAYQHTEIRHLVEAMAKAAGVYSPRRHTMDALLGTPVKACIAEARALMAESAEARAIYDGYYDPMIKYLMEADLALYDIPTSAPDYHETHPMELAASWFKLNLTCERRIIKGVDYRADLPHFG